PARRDRPCWPRQRRGCGGYWHRFSSLSAFRFPLAIVLSLRKERRLKDGDWWKVAGIGFDFDKAGLPTRPLCKARGALVAGEHVRVSMFFQRLFSCRIDRIIPGAGGK